MTGADIKELREHLGLDQRSMAIMIGCYQHHLSRWESGTVKPGKQWQTIFQHISDNRNDPQLLAKARLAEGINLAEGHARKRVN